MTLVDPLRSSMRNFNLLNYHFDKDFIYYISFPLTYFAVNALYQKSDLCILRNETVWPRSQFLHSCICEQFIYSQDKSAYSAAAK